MRVVTRTIFLRSKGEGDMINITPETSKILTQSKLKDGIITIFVSGSTAAVTTIEYEPGLKQDFPHMLSIIVPRDMEYQHENMWHDGNGQLSRESIFDWSKSDHSIQGQYSNVRNLATDSLFGNGY
jgi:thiamine phosphate synthase YjbQ (UPF0047 family)